MQAETPNNRKKYFKMLLRIINKLLIIIVLFLLSSCGEKEMNFDEKKWNERLDGSYKYREYMVSDLMGNHLEKGMKYNQVIELLGLSGKYQNIKSNEISYEIMVDYGWNIDPVEGKNLYFEFDKDSIIKNIRLEHWKH